jgi:hypothetical protein
MDVEYHLRQAVNSEHGRSSLVQFVGGSLPSKSVRSEVFRFFV